MWLLLLPVVTFILFWSASLFLEGLDSERKFTGRFSHLNLIVPILMSAKDGARMMTCSPTRRVVNCEVVFGDGRVRVGIPLITAAQLKRSSELLKIFQTYDKGAVRINGKDGRPTLTGYLYGDATAVSDCLQSLLMSIWGVDDNRQVSFEFDSHHNDINCIARDWERYYKTNADAPPIAWTASATEQQTKSVSRGCMLFLADFLLKPILMIVAFYWYGLWAAIVTTLVVWAIQATYKLYATRQNLNIHWTVYAWVIIPAATISSLYTGNENYFKMLPTLVCVSFAIKSFITLLAGQKTEQTRPTELVEMHLWSNLAFLGASIIAAFISEYMRVHLDTEAWIWYYAYIRIELIVLLIPAVFGIAYMTTSRQADEIKDASTR